MGYAARCVQQKMAGYAEQQAVGAQLTDMGPIDVLFRKFTSTLGMSAVFVEQLNVFEVQAHSNNDDFVVRYRYWDDGRKTWPGIGWEGHDEGDMSANAATASWSASREITWMSVEEVAQLLNKSADEFTLDKFKQVYTDVWIKTHEKEAATDNANAEAELEIIEEVENETDSTGETTVPAAPGTAEDGGTTDPADPTEDDSSSGRKLASVAARFASAALRVFGI